MNPTYSIRGLMIVKGYIIPRDVKGETRILTYFTPKSFLFTVIGIIIGTVFYMFFKMLTLNKTGLIVLVIISVLSFGIGALKIPETSAFPFFKDAGGETIDDIIMRYIKFNGIKFLGLKSNKRIYIYGRRES
ncbi:MAG: PrgI family mobile element protein [Chloroflexota bacterium]